MALLLITFLRFELNALRKDQNVPSRRRIDVDVNGAQMVVGGW